MCKQIVRPNHAVAHHFIDPNGFSCSLLTSNRSVVQIVPIGRFALIENKLINDLVAPQSISQSIDPVSGSAQDGPTWGYRFVPGQPARQITSEEAVKFLTAQDPALPA